MPIKCRTRALGLDIEDRSWTEWHPVTNPAVSVVIEAVLTMWSDVTVSITGTLTAEGVRPAVGGEIEYRVNQ